MWRYGQTSSKRRVLPCSVGFVAIFTLFDGGVWTIYKRCFLALQQNIRKNEKYEQNQRKPENDSKGPVTLNIFGLMQSRQMVCTSPPANTRLSWSCSKPSFSGQGVSHEIAWVILPPSCFLFFFFADHHHVMVSVFFPALLSMARNA